MVPKWVDMTLGKQNNEEMMTPEAPVIRKDDGEKDFIAEIAVNKNRERFAINKSYSIEVCINNITLRYVHQKYFDLSLFNAFVFYITEWIQRSYKKYC